MSMTTCVFCQATTNLNTEMTITLDDGKKVQVRICDEHAEDATVKSVKQAYVSKLDKLSQLLAAAKDLGLDLNAMFGAPAQPQPETQKPTPPPRPARPKTVEFEDDNNVIDTGTLRRSKPMSVAGPQAESHSAFDTDSVQINEELKNGKAHLAVVEGRGGAPIILPDKVVDGTGVTTIKIVKTEDDSTLQKRFKRMSQDENTHFAKSGYANTTKDCPLCRSSGTVMNGGKLETCPKCSGSGLLSTM